MTLRNLLEVRLSAALEAAGAPAGSQALVGPATRPEFGDYQSNGVMAVARKLRVNPRELAQKVVQALDLDDLAASVTIAGPGFINVTLKPEWLAQRLEAALGDERLGVERAACPDTVVVDYGNRGCFGLS